MTERLSQPPRPRQSVRPIGLRGPSKLPSGPRLYSQAPERKGAGAGEAPPGFVGGSTSGSEWILYVAATKVRGTPRDPRQPPFFGGDDWGFQIAMLGTFTRELGSAVADFVFYQPGGNQIIVRLQTDRFHAGFGPTQQGGDVLQRALLEGQGDVVDIWEGSYIDADPNVSKPYESTVVLQAACAAVRDAISLVERGSEINLGTSQARG